MPEPRELRAAFVAAIERSFLPPREKEELRKAAENGVTPELWNHFNDLLIDAIVRNQGAQKKYVKGLDEEIDRFTKHYEKEKTVLDNELRGRLAALGKDDRDEREALWDEYRGRIAKLQRRLLREVDRSSSTVLHDVVLATVKEE